MAEFCLECWNKINGTNDTESEVILSKRPEFCEECCGIKKVVIGYKCKMDMRERLYLFCVRLDDICYFCKNTLYSIKSQFKSRR